MHTKNRYFELSDRKLMLRFFDSFFVLLGLFLFGFFLGIEYLEDIVTNLKSVLLLVLYISFFGTVFELYDVYVAKNEFQVLRAISLTVSTTVLVYLLTPLLSPTLPPNRFQILSFFSVFFLSLFFWRLFYLKYLTSSSFSQNVVLICEESDADVLISDFESTDPYFKIIGYVTTDSISELGNIEHQSVEHVKRSNLMFFVEKNKVSEIIIAAKNTEGITPLLYHQLIQLMKSGTLITEYNQVYESKIQRIPVQFIAKDFYRFFPFNKKHNNILYLSIVVFFDVSFSFIGLLFGICLLPLVLIGNLIGNRGCLFYTQTRIGKGGVPFEILKLRTMVKNAETNGAVFATVNDSRITAFGKFLRKTRIDEIPQFLNVLRGEMAIIGPRPERPEIVAQIIERIPIYETRHIVKPGLTGWAQVNYSYGENIGDSLVKLQYDLYYIKNRSIHLDVTIAVKTITTVLFYRGQ